MLPELEGDKPKSRPGALNTLGKSAFVPARVNLLDIGMPGRDGYEACLAMRRASWGKAHMIVALTGGAPEDGRPKVE